MIQIRHRCKVQNPQWGLEKNVNCAGQQFNRASVPACPVMFYSTFV